MGECVPSLYLGLLYCTLDIKLNVPWNSWFFFFFKFKDYYDDFVVLLTFWFGGAVESRLILKKLLLCSSKWRKRLCVSFFLKTYFFPAGIIKDKETWHLLLFDTLSQDIAVESNVGQLHRVPARRLGTECIGTVGWPKWDILWIGEEKKRYSDHF